MKKVIVGLVMICAMIFTIGCDKKDPQAKDCKKLYDQLSVCSPLVQGDQSDVNECIDKNDTLIYQTYDSETFRRFNELYSCEYVWKNYTIDGNTKMSLVWDLEDYCDGEYRQCGM